MEKKQNKQYFEGWVVPERTTDLVDTLLRRAESNNHFACLASHLYVGCPGEVCSICLLGSNVEARAAFRRFALECGADESIAQMEAFNPGDIVEIVDCEMACMVGRMATVVPSDDADKIKVSFDSQWQGYYSPDQLKKRSEIADLLCSDTPSLSKAVKEKLLRSGVVHALIAMRAQAKLTQQELAKKLNWTLKKIKRVEFGVDDYLTWGDIKEYATACGRRVAIALLDVT